MTGHGDVNFRNLPPDLAMMAREAQASLVAEAIRSGDVRFASKQDVARHEAGHVVGSALLGAGTRHCWVRGTEGVWIGYTEPRDMPAWGIPTGDGRRLLTPPGALARAVFCLAGSLAERTEGGGDSLANLATDLPEMMEGAEALRSAVVVAVSPDAPPANDEALEAIQHMHGAMLARLFVWIVGELTCEAKPLNAIARKLGTHGRLISHEIAPLVRGVTSISTDDLFDHLRQGLAIGPLPRDNPAAYLTAELPNLAPVTMRGTL